MRPFARNVATVKDQCSAFNKSYLRCVHTVCLPSDVARMEFRDLSDEEQYARIFVSERKTDARREGT